VEDESVLSFTLNLKVINGDENKGNLVGEMFGAYRETINMHKIFGEEPETTELLARSSGLSMDILVYYSPPHTRLSFSYLLVYAAAVHRALNVVLHNQYL
jgi:hypothetical protein